jgi:hypothetical protein
MAMDSATDRAAFDETVVFFGYFHDLQDPCQQGHDGPPFARAANLAGVSGDLTGRAHATLRQADPGGNAVEFWPGSAGSTRARRL